MPILLKVSQVMVFKGTTPNLQAQIAQTKSTRKSTIFLCHPMDHKAD
jgi:hypothetical protein